MNDKVSIPITDFSGKSAGECAQVIADAITGKGKPMVTEADVDKWGYHYSDKAIEMLKEYEKKNSCKHVDYVFEIFARYRGDSKYEVFHELCEFDYDDHLCWETDWFEGQQDIIYNRFAPADDIYDFYFKHVGDNKGADL